MLIALDAGHGGSDPGAVSDNNYEKDYALKISKYMYDRFNELGIPVTLTRDSDILKSLGEVKTHQILVGFAAESNDVLKNAEKKLKNKNLDFIVANDITATDTGFGSEDNKVIIISKDNEKLELEKMSKREVARNIFDMILEKR